MACRGRHPLAPFPPPRGQSVRAEGGCDCMFLGTLNDGAKKFKLSNRPPPVPNCKVWAPVDKRLPWAMTRPVPTLVLSVNLVDDAGDDAVVEGASAVSGNVVTPQIPIPWDGTVRELKDRMRDAAGAATHAPIHITTAGGSPVSDEPRRQNARDSGAPDPQVDRVCSDRPARAGLGGEGNQARWRDGGRRWRRRRSDEHTELVNPIGPGDLSIRSIIPVAPMLCPSRPGAQPLGRPPSRGPHVDSLRPEAAPHRAVRTPGQRAGRCPRRAQPRGPGSPAGASSFLTLIVQFHK